MGCTGTSRPCPDHRRNQCSGKINASASFQHIWHSICPHGGLTTKPEQGLQPPAKGDLRGRLSASPQVFVAGFQTERGEGQFLTHQLQYLRPGVRLLDLGGSFAEALLAPPDQTCLILIGARRYSRLTRRMAHGAGGARSGHPRHTDHRPRLPIGARGGGRSLCRP